MTRLPSQSGPGAGLPAGTVEKVADVMFALSTPSRVQILGCLLDSAHSVGELTELLGMEQSAVSHQLRVLREHTLVKAEWEGRRRLYRLYDEHVTALLEAALRHVEERARSRGSRPARRRDQRALG